MTFNSGGTGPPYQFEFTFTELELKRAYRYLGSRGLGQLVSRGEHSVWNLYWISNLLLRTLKSRLGEWGRGRSKLAEEGT
jgi:hypothetical protein